MTNTTLSTLDSARLIALTLTTPRFRGRTELLRLAESGDATALRALELTEKQRAIACLRGELSPEADRAVRTDAVGAARQLRQKRIDAIVVGCDRLAQRKPGNVAARATKRALVAALWDAGFRHATHSHDETISIVARGQEGCSSESSSAWASDVGLPNAYSRKGFRVATSKHAWRVSAEIFRVAPGARAESGLVYLSPTIRVRQGRGTSLVVERLIENARGRAVWA